MRKITLRDTEFVPEGCCHTVTTSLIDSERMKRMERYIVRALRYIRKSLRQGEHFELVIRDSNGHLVKKYKSRPVAGRDDC